MILPDASKPTKPSAVDPNTLHAMLIRAIAAMRSAFGLMTVIPVGTTDRLDKDAFAHAPAFFPLVGAVVGLLTATVMHYTPAELDVLGAALAVCAWIAVTGALHLDGVADTADAVLASTTPQRRQQIAKDPTVGTFAVVTLIGLILLKVTALHHIQQVSAVVAAAVVARSWVVVVMRTFAVAAHGTLAQASKPSVAITAASLVAGVAILLAVQQLGNLAITPFAASLVAAMMASTAAVAWSAKRMGGCNGDIYGMCIEVTEVVFVVTHLLVQATGPTMPLALP